MLTRLQSAFAFGALAAILSPLAWSDGTRLVPLDPRQDYFAGQEIRIGYTAPGVANWEGNAKWTLSVNDRPLNRGMQRVSISDSREAFGVAVSLPPLRDDQVFDVVLAVKLVDQHGNIAAAGNRKLRLFGRNPFAHQVAWLQSLNIQLYDPQGRTHELLEAANIPFTSLPSLDRSRLDSSGVLLIGDSTALNRRSSEFLQSLPSSGLSVICLAPVEGSFAMSFAQLPVEQRPSELRFSDARIAGALKGQPQTTAGQLAFTAISSSVHLRGSKLGATADVQADASGWPWLEYRHPRSKASFIVVGFAIVPGWHESPAARYLLDAILHHAAPANPSRPSQSHRSAQDGQGQSL